MFIPQSKLLTPLHQDKMDIKGFDKASPFLFLFIRSIFFTPMVVFITSGDIINFSLFQFRRTKDEKN